MEGNGDVILHLPDDTQYSRDPGNNPLADIKPASHRELYRDVTYRKGQIRENEERHTYFMRAAIPNLNLPIP
ncbi:hypothetical protein AcV5_007254 [Taiwanofungus camphoratus]|nr:hypothetical protein AcV5_007254 [Antrodia cinnamomea]